MIGPNSPTFVEGKTPREERCFGKNVALRLYFMSWPILWPFTCESSWDRTMNTIWLWRLETLTCLKCCVMTSWKTLFSINLVLKMMAGEVFLLPYRLLLLKWNLLNSQLCLTCFMKSLATVFHPAFKLQYAVFIKALNSLSFVPSVYLFYPIWIQYMYLILQCQ